MYILRVSYAMISTDYGYLICLVFCLLILFKISVLSGGGIVIFDVFALWLGVYGFLYMGVEG